MAAFVLPPRQGGVRAGDFLTGEDVKKQTKGYQLPDLSADLLQFDLLP
jgi:hypothetical protein